MQEAESILSRRIDDDSITLEPTRCRHLRHEGPEDAARIDVVPAHHPSARFRLERGPHRREAVRLELSIEQELPHGPLSRDLLDHLTVPHHMNAAATEEVDVILDTHDGSGMNGSL